LRPAAPRWAFVARQQTGQPITVMADTHLLIRRYYEAFNERRFGENAELFTADAVLQHRPRAAPLKGPEGYLESARQATTSFPDLRFQILHVEQRGDTIVEIDVSATGTLVGDWTAGSFGTLKATGKTKTFRIRETLEIRGGKITFSSLTYDLQELLGQPGPPR
jgi:predicted ester cyclase